MKTITTIILTGLALGFSITGSAQTWWAQTSSTSERLQNVNFSTNQTGYLFGDTLSTVIKTSASGAPWNTNFMNFTQGNLRSSAITGTSTIYAVGVYDVLGGKGLVMKSSDAGATWTFDTSIPEDLFDVSFPDMNVGFISGENGYVAKTTNSGATWTALNTGTGEDLFSVKFVNQNEGWAVGTVDVNAVIYHTSDGGLNWTLQTSGLLESLFAVDFVDNMNGWAVGSLGNIIVTNDGGATWTAQTSGVTGDLYDIDMLDQNNGWAVGSGGTVLKTTDGGMNWVAELSGTGTDILSIHMRSTTLGWFCGDGGVVHIYAINPPSVGISENQMSDGSLYVYPNPAQDEFSFTIDSNLENCNYKLIDMQGRIIKNDRCLSEGVQTVEVTAVEKGSYLLIVETNNEIIKQTKVIIN